MRVLIPSIIWPSPEHSERAANVILNELITGLLQVVDLNVLFLKMSPWWEPSSPRPRGLLDGPTYLQTLVVPRPRDKPRLTAKSRVYPQVGQVRASDLPIARSEYDVVMPVLSDWVTMLISDWEVPKAAYYGNPDPKVARARMMLERKFGEGEIESRLKQTARVHLLERVHNQQMKQFAVLSNVARNDAFYYTEQGHPRSLYVQNVWPDRFPDLKRREPVRGESFRIVGNVGRLSSTANSFGLYSLGRELVPRLRGRIPNFVVDVFGAGEPYPTVRRSLNVKEVRLRGFVPDIDKEIHEADVFVCLNNASMFKVCHTRYLHAWSLKTCVIAHKDASLSIPEMKHGQNALLGGSQDEIADLIVEASLDRKLRNRVALGGYETFRQSFTGTSVGNRIAAKMLTSVFN